MATAILQLLEDLLLDSEGHWVVTQSTQYRTEVDTPALAHEGLKSVSFQLPARRTCCRHRLSLLCKTKTSCCSSELMI